MSNKKLSISECDRIITAPGQILEMEQMTIHGQVQRTWKTLPKTFREFILTSFEVYPERIFMSSPLPLSQGVDAREHVTFRDTLQKAIRVAAWMRSKGLGIGSKVAIGGGNSTGWVVSWLAIHLLGGIGIALNAWLPQDALLHCLKLTKPDMILVDEERVELFSAMKGDLAESKIYCWSEIKMDGGDIKSNVNEISKVTSTQVQDIREGAFLKGRDLGPESDAVIFFTSGTGGRPKAVLSTQRMALSNLWSGFVAPFRAALRAGQPLPPLPKPSDPQRTVLLSIPLFHVTGNLSWLMRAIHGGSKMVYMRHWNVKEAVKLILNENVSVIGGVPAVAASLLHSTELPKDRDFATVFYGGAPPSKQLAAEVKQRWPKAAIVQGYGMTETNAYVCSVAGTDYLERPESTGPPVPISDLRIVDPTTKKPLPSGQSGLLLVRGPQVMKCYYGDEAATKETIDPEGWLDTGDAGLIDEEGFLYIKDRLKDIIIRGGENIASQDVENAFYADKRVAEAAAIGVPDERLGELVGVIVSLHPSSSGVKESDLLESVKPRLARHALPAIVVIHDGPLPRNVNGKLVKKDLKPSLVKIWNERNAKKTRSKL